MTREPIASTGSRGEISHRTTVVDGGLRADVAYGWRGDGRMCCIVTINHEPFVYFGWPPADVVAAQARREHES